MGESITTNSRLSKKAHFVPFIPSVPHFPLPADESFPYPLPTGLLAICWMELTFQKPRAQLGAALGMSSQDSILGVPWFNRATASTFGDLRQRLSVVSFPLSVGHYDTAAMIKVLKEEHFVRLMDRTFGPMTKRIGSTDDDPWMQEANVAALEGGLSCADAAAFVDFFSPGSTLGRIMLSTAPVSNAPAFYSALRANWKVEAGSRPTSLNAGQTRPPLPSAADAQNAPFAHELLFDIPLQALCVTPTAVLSEPETADLTTLPADRISSLVLLPIWRPPFVTRTVDGSLRTALKTQMVFYFLIRLCLFIIRAGGDKGPELAPLDPPNYFDMGWNAAVNAFHAVYERAYIALLGGPPNAIVGHPFGCSLHLFRLWSQALLPSAGRITPISLFSALRPSDLPFASSGSSRAPSVETSWSAEGLAAIFLQQLPAFVWCRWSRADNSEMRPIRNLTNASVMLYYVPMLEALVSPLPLNVRWDGPAPWLNAAGRFHSAIGGRPSVGVRLSAPSAGGQPLGSAAAALLASSDFLLYFAACTARQSISTIAMAVDRCPVHHLEGSLALWETLMQRLARAAQQVSALGPVPTSDSAHSLAMSVAVDTFVLCYPLMTIAVTDFMSFLASSVVLRDTASLSPTAGVQVGKIVDIIQNEVLVRDLHGIVGQAVSDVLASRRSTGGTRLSTNGPSATSLIDRVRKSLTTTSWSLCQGTELNPNDEARPGSATFTVPLFNGPEMQQAASRAASALKTALADGREQLGKIREPRSSLAQRTRARIASLEAIERVAVRLCPSDAQRIKDSQPMAPPTPSQFATGGSRGAQATSPRPTRPGTRTSHRLQATSPDAPHFSVPRPYRGDNAAAANATQTMMADSSTFLDAATLAQRHRQFTQREGPRFSSDEIACVARLCLAMDRGVESLRTRRHVLRTRALPVCHRGHPLTLVSVASGVFCSQHRTAPATWQCLECQLLFCGDNHRSDAELGTYCRPGPKAYVPDPDAPWLTAIKTFTLRWTTLSIWVPSLTSLVNVFDEALDCGQPLGAGDQEVVCERCRTLMLFGESRRYYFLNGAQQRKWLCADCASRPHHHTLSTRWMAHHVTVICFVLLCVWLAWTNRRSPPYPESAGAAIDEEGDRYAPSGNAAGYEFEEFVESY